MGGGHDRSRCCAGHGELVGKGGKGEGEIKQEARVQHWEEEGTPLYGELLCCYREEEEKEREKKKGKEEKKKRERKKGENFLNMEISVEKIKYNLWSWFKNIFLKNSPNYNKTLGLVFN
jgi:hypothetical protein